MAKPQQSKNSPLAGSLQGVDPELRQTLERMEGEIQSLRNKLATEQSTSGGLKRQVEELKQATHREEQTRKRIDGDIEEAGHRELRREKRQQETSRTVDRMHVYHVYNDSGEQIPARAACEITDKSANAELYNVNKPSADSLSPGIVLINGPIAIPADSRGIAYSPFDFAVTAGYSGDITSVCDVGTANDSWTLKVDNYGFSALYADSENSLCRILPNASGGAKSTVLAETTGSPSNGVYPCDLYGNGFDSDATETNVDVEVLNLNASEELPDGTKLIVTKSKTAHTAIQ